MTLDRRFESVLYLDDMRTPTIFGIEVVRNYDQFVWYLTNKPMPELISFDHDLDLSHYDVFNGVENVPGIEIPYVTYKEKTGRECARFIVQNSLPLRYWAVHSFNAQGKINIENDLRAYCPQGEVRGLQIPYRCTH